MVTARSSQTGYAQSQFKIQFNSDTATNYKRRETYGAGTGSSIGTSTGTGEGGILYIYVPAANAGANIFGNANIYIPNYAGSTQKSVHILNGQEDNIQTAYLQNIVGLWTGTAAITSIQLTEQNGQNLTAYSTASLYGIKNS